MEHLRKGLNIVARNLVILLGNLTKDPELRSTPQGTKVCTFSIACNERYKDKNGQQQDKAEFVNLVAWGNLAEIIAKHFQKGKEIYVEGKLQTRSYDDKEGTRKYVTEVVVKEFSFTGSGGGAKPSGESAARMAERVMNEPDDFDQIPF